MRLVWVSGGEFLGRGGYLRSSILQNRCGDSSAYWVEVVGEMILGQHGVSWVTGVRVVPWDELLVSTRLHHCSRSILQGLRDLLNDRSDERREKRHDEDRDLLTDRFHKLLKPWDLSNGSIDRLDDFVTEL